MADREQIWRIVADFSSLTTQSRRAARAVRELDDARESASKRKDREIFKPGEIDNVDKMTAALQGTVQARRAETRQLKIHQARLEGLNQSIEGNTRATDTSTSSVRASTAAISNHGKAVRSANKDHNALSRSMSRGSSTARNAGQNVGFLAKAFADILPASRSWALFMKMIPLTAVTSGVNTLLPAVAGLGGAFVGLAGTIGPVIGLLGALPTMFVAAAGSVGGLIAGLGGIVGAMSAYNNMTEAQGKAEFKSATASKSAARSRERSLRSTARSLERAKRDRIEAARDIKDAEAALAETAVTNERNIARAEEAVADAHQDVVRAQKAVTDARRDAANALDDYRLKLRGAALDEEGAVLALKQARAQLAEAMIDPGTSALEQKQASLAVRQAELRLDEVREANKDLAKEAADAQAKGIEGSDLVVDAKEREIDAQEAARDAQIGLQDAYKDSAKATQAAQRSLEDSKQAYIDSGERVVELQETLADLKTTIEETGEAADPAATQIAAFEAAMAKLTPEARAVVKELIALKDAWGGIQQSSQQAMAPGLLSFLQDLRFKLLPFISIFVTRMAKGAGDFFEAFGDLITTRASLEAWSEIFVDAEHFMSLLGEATLNVTEWLLGLGRAARKSGLTVWIGKVIRNWTKGWKKAVDTPTGIDAVAESMKDSMYYAEQWGEAISQVWKFFRTFFKGFRPLGLWTLQNIRDTAEAWNNFLKSPGGQDKLKLWQGLAKVNLTGLANAIKVITDQGPKMFGADMRKGTENFQAFWDALNGTTPDTGFINALGDLLGIVDAEMITNILGLGEAIAGMLQSLGENGGMSVVIKMVSLFEKFANIVDGLFQTVPGLASSVMLLLSVLSAKKLIVALGQLTGANLITTAMNSARAQGYGGKNKAMVGATVANFMGFGNMVPDRTTEQGAATYAALTPQGRKEKAAQVAADRERARQQRAYRAVATKQLSSSNAATRAAGQATLDSLGDPSRVKKLNRVSGAIGGVGRAVGLLGAAFMGAQVAGGVLNQFAAAAPGIDKTAVAMERLAKAAKYGGKADLDSLFRNSKDPTKALTGGVAADDFIFTGRTIGGVGSLKEALELKKLLEESFNVAGDKLRIRDFFQGLAGAESQIDLVNTSLTQLDQTLLGMSGEALAANFAELEKQGKAAQLTTEQILQQIPQTADVTKKALEAASDGMYKFKTGPEEVAEVLRGNLPEGLVMTEEGLMNVAQAAERNLKPIDKNTIATEEFKAALEEQESVMQDAISAYNDAKDAVQGLNDAQRDASGLFMSEQEAADRYAATLAELSQVIVDNGTSVMGQSEGARANREYLRGLATDARDYTDSLLANGASVDVVNAKMLTQRNELLKVLESFGIVGKEANDYADDLGLIPNYVGTTVAVEGGKLAAEEADALNERIKDLPDSAKTEIITVAIREGYDEALLLIEDIEARSAEVDIKFNYQAGWSSEAIKLQDLAMGRADWSTKRADGGYIQGPGTTTSDSIPALLSNREYVVKASSVEKIGVSNLNHMNRTGRLPGYARGGLVGPQKFANGGLATSVPVANGVPLDTSWGTAMVKWWNTLWTTLAGNTETSWNNITKTISGGWDASIKALKNLAPGLSTWWSGVWSGMTTTLSNAWTTSKSGTKTFVEGFQNIFHQLQSVVRGPLSSIVSFVNTTLGGLVNGVASFFGVKSPFPISVSTSMPASAKVAVKGFSDGGWTGPGGRLQPVGVVHGDEYVIKKSSRKKIERKSPGLLDHMNRTGSPGYAEGGRVLPVSGRESGNYKDHSGIDYAVPVGTPVRSPEAGVVSYTRRMTTSFGNHIVQSFSSGFRGVFAHLSRMAVEAGDKVSKGQVVGYSGNTGNSTGPHLHFEVTRGSLGAAANREVTRSWLGGAASLGLPDGKQIVNSGSGIWDQIFKMTESLASPLANLKTSLGSSGFGQLLGAGAGKFVEWGSKKAQDLFKALGVSGPLDNIAQVIGNFTGATQRDNAFGIADVAWGRGMGKRGALLGIMAAMQESGLKNINYGDRDSVGLFQQRPSAGWGTVAQIMDPSYAANKFFAALAKVKGWMTGPEWQDIQAVQISAFPTAYQKHKARAQQYVDEWAKSKGYADGGWTGPGSRLQPAGVVHADEYVINKGSRRRLERTAPGLLDHLNTKGTLPGYATGGAVTPWDGKSFPGSSAFRLGKSHPAVTLLGKMLVKKGFGRHYRVGPGPTFTSADLKNMQEYQRSQGWSGTSANGYPGPTSWGRLYSAYSPTVATPKPTAVATAAAATSAIPTSLKGLTVFLSYLEKAQMWDATHGLSNTLFETRRQTQLVSTLLNKEGLLASSAVDGHFGTAEAEAWKKWQAKNSMTETGIVDADSLAPLLSKYGVAFNKDIPFAPGSEQPSRFDVISGSLTASNKTLAEYMGYLGKIRAWGFSNVFETLKGLGPNGIPEEYRDSENPMTGMEMAKMLSASVTAARQYEEALREAARLGGDGDAMSKKMGEMVDLLMWGLDGPYGLQSAAKTLGVSMDTAALLYKKITEQGSLKDVPTTRTARIRNDVADFDNLFKFAKGGIVPGVGNSDSVMAMLTPGEMVIPKSVVAEMFRSTPSVTPFLNLASRISGRSDTTGTGNGGNTYEFHTNVYNPVAEESSMSVQKRVKSLANLGMLGGRRS